MNLKSGLVELNNHLTELLRVLILQVILAPAAYLLPERLAFAAADVSSLPLALLPSPGFTSYRRMRRLFGGGRYRSFRLAWARIASPFRDFVTTRRVMYGREDVSTWRIVEKNAEEVTKLRETGRSFIVATGHFQRAALPALACPRVTPGNYIQVAHAAPRRLTSPYDLRLRIQYGTLLKVLSTAWRRPFEFAFTNTGQHAARFIYERLMKPGNIVNIHLDSAWQQRATGSFCRPFAGKTDRSFATGAAQLAKLCKCPLVGCVYWRDDDGTFVVQWGQPILHVDDEIDAMNCLIDALETAIGERPTQYALDIGQERRWNESNRRWES